MTKKKVVKEEVVEDAHVVSKVELPNGDVVVARLSNTGNVYLGGGYPDNKAAAILEPAREVVTFVKVRSRDNFKDGAFTKELAECGYKTYWPREEVRLLPAQLFAKLQRRSGNRFDMIGG